MRRNDPIERQYEGVCVCVSHVPGMHVIVDGQSSTILTAGHPAATGGTVTMET